MREKIDPELKKEWEKKLSEAGLGNIKHPKEVPVESAETLSVEHLISPDLLKQFSVLPEKLRDDIIEDAKKQHQAGRSFDDICERAKTLIDKGEELAEMDEANSDKEYRPRELEIGKLKKEEEAIIENSEELIKRLEELAGSKENDEETSKKETIH